MSGTLSYSVAVDNILERAWKHGIALQSQYFRDNPRLVALAASLGLITTIDPIGDYGNVWRISPKGCTHLFNTSQETDYEFNNLESNAMDTEAPVHSMGSLATTAGSLSRVCKQLAEASTSKTTGDCSGSGESKGIRGGEG